MIDEKGLEAARRANEIMLAETKTEGGLPRVDWYRLRNSIAAALSAAYLSARSAEPVAWRLLQNGEIIEAADQVLADDTVTWLPLKGWEIGLPYYSGVYVPARRAHPTLEASDA